jgi:hypothetical protein
VIDTLGRRYHGMRHVVRSCRVVAGTLARHSCVRGGLPSCRSFCWFSVDIFESVLELDGVDVVVASLRSAVDDEEDEEDGDDEGGDAEDKVVRVEFHG